MRLYALFCFLNIQLDRIFASPPNSLGLSAQANHDQKGYECGNVFFTNLEVNEALSLALASVDKGYSYPQRYQGKLYSESKFKEYLLWPIRKGPRILPQTKNPETTFRVVFTRSSNEVIDVVAKITTADYTKCILRDISHVGPSHSEPEIPNGYLCGHKFFTDETVHQSLALAQNNVEEKAKYPSPYVGLIYPEGSGHLIWPITRGKKLYKSGTCDVGPYYLILNKERQFVDVVVRGYRSNFLRCIRSRKPPKAPASDPYSKLFVQPPKFGYLCGKSFFDNKVLEEDAEIAKSQASNVIKGQFPEEYFGPPYYQPCLIWPILKDGSLFKKGNKGLYRLILTPNYKVMSVAILIKGKLKVCERKTIVAKKNHDTSGYRCYKRRYSHQQLVTAAERACVKMNAVGKNVYPARYEGPGFELEGPYFTYPVLRDRVFRQHVGLDRVVINTNCEVVGALTSLVTLENQYQKRLVKCHRLDDGPLPAGFFGANAETVYEYKINY